MSAWLMPLQRVLDDTNKPVTVFFRDDDIGWSNDNLYRLLNVFADHRVPLDLAIIPNALTELLAQRLCTHAQSHPIGLHQHGFTHHNHETQGRKYEFGPSRTYAQQLNDLQVGREILQALLGEYLDPIFTPPWNRCTEITAACLTELGYSLLSRDRSAKPLRFSPINELPIHIDWQKSHKDHRFDLRRLSQSLVDAIKAQSITGIMLHHAVMVNVDFSAIDELLSLLSEHNQVNCSLMRNIHTHKVH